MLWIYHSFNVIRDWIRRRRSEDRERGHRTPETGRRLPQDKFKGSLSEGQTLTIDLDSDEE